MDAQAYYLFTKDASKRRIMPYSPADLDYDLKKFKVKNAIELSNPEFIVTRTREEAELFLERFLSIQNNLSTLAACKDKLPKMLYKRRYIVLALMRLKTKTLRHYDKGIRAGDVFAFYDQINCLKVRCTAFKKLSANKFQYDYELID